MFDVIYQDMHDIVTSIGIRIVDAGLGFVYDDLVDILFDSRFMLLVVTLSWASKLLGKL